MFHPAFHWLIIAAAVTGAAFGFFSGREKGAAQSLAPSPTAQTQHESIVPAQTEREAAPQLAIAEEKDLAAICQMRSESRREAALLAFADSLDAKSVQAAIDEAQSLSAVDRARVLATLFARWAELAPEAAANRAIEKKGEQDGALRAVVAEWAALDPAALWQWAQAQPKGAVRLGDVLGEIAVHNAPMAWQWAQKTDRGILDPRDLSELFKQWGWHDGVEAFRVAQSLSGSSSLDVMVAVIGGWATSNPQAAFAAAREIKDRETRENAFEELFQPWAESDPHAAMEALLTLPSRKAYSNYFDDLTYVLANRDLQALPALVDRVAPGPERHRILGLLVNRLASADPAAAFAAAQRITNDSERSNELAHIVERAGAGRLAELKELAAALPNPEDREAVQKGIDELWADSNPVGVANAALLLADRERRQTLLQTALNKWPDPNAALQWTGAIADEADRAIVLRGIYSRLAETEPQRAATYLDQLDQREQPAFASRIIQEWIKHDPAAASAWALKLPGDALRESAVATIVEAELPFGIPETAAWMDTLPSGNLRDAAIVRFCDPVERIDAPTALAWALTIAAPEKQRATVSRIVRAWQDTDPEAAKRWIEETDFYSAEAKKKLLE